MRETNKIIKHPIPSLRSKLRRIILLPMLAVMLILLGVIIFGTIVVRNAMIERQQLIVHGIARQGTQYLEETGKLMRSLAYAMIGFSPEQQQELLARIRDSYLRFSALYLVDSTGKVVVEHTDAPRLLGFDMSEERFFRAGRDAEMFYFSEPFISLATHQITVTMAASIVIEDRFHGMLVGELNLERLQQIIAQVPQGDMNRTFITDHRGKLVAHPEHSWVQEQRNLGNLPLIQTGLHGKNTSEIFYDRDLKAWLFGSVAPMAWGWIVVTTQPVRVAARPLFLVIFISLAAYGLSLLIFLWTQVRNLRQIIHPIALLTQQANRLANEEYNTESPEMKEAFAEILSLNQSFIHMAEAVAERTTALKIVNTDLKEELQKRQKIEEALRESEEFLHNIVENIPNMIFVKDARDLRFVRFNKAGEALLGYSRQELIGKNDHDFFPKHEADFFTQHDRDVLEQCTLVDIPEEIVYTREQGERILHTKKIPILDKKGNPAYLLGISEDITERKQAEEKLEQFFSVNLDLLCIADIEGNFIKVNKAWESTLGYSTSELERRKFLEFVHPEDIDSTLKAMSQLGAKEQVLNFVNRYRCMDGSYRFIEWRSQPSGNLIYAAARDITDRRQAEESLRKSEEKMRSIFRIAPTGIGVVSNRVLLDVNARICEMTGYAKEELIGQSARVLYPTQEDFEFVGREKYKQIAQKGSGAVETRWQKKDGSIIDILLASTPIDLADLSRGVTFTALDITDRKRAEEEIRCLNAELEQRVRDRTAELEAANHELQSFAYVVSHDLKAPLRAINRLVKWLVEDYAGVFDAKGHEMVELLLGRVKRMDDLINGILAYSRIGRMAVHAEPIELQHVLPDVIDSLAPPPNIQISIASALPIIHGDIIRIQQVFANLIGNAMKFLDKPQGIITIRCEEAGADWQFSVADNGPGIDPKYHEKIFQIFQTLHPRDEVESTGVGLAIVKKIVEFYGGKVWVESEVGQGSTFWFTVPKTIQNP